MGGKILIEFLEQLLKLLGSVVDLVLIDPTLPNQFWIENIRGLLDKDTLLIASEGEVNSQGDISSMLLGIPTINFHGTHREIPNKALNEVIKFSKDRIP